MVPSTSMGVTIATRLPENMLLHALERCGAIARGRCGMLRSQRGLKQAQETGTLPAVNDPNAPGKQHLAVSAIGGDHTGMVHELTRVITGCGGNIAGSRMAGLGSGVSALMWVTGTWHTLSPIESQLASLPACGALGRQHR